VPTFGGRSHARLHFFKTIDTLVFSPPFLELSHDALTAGYFASQSFLGDFRLDRSFFPPHGIMNLPLPLTFFHMRLLFLGDPFHQFLAGSRRYNGDVMIELLPLLKLPLFVLAFMVLLFLFPNVSPEFLKPQFPLADFIAMISSFPRSPPFSPYFGEFSL